MKKTNKIILGICLGVILCVAFVLGLYFDVFNIKEENTDNTETNDTTNDLGEEVQEDICVGIFVAFRNTDNLYDREEKAYVTEDNRIYATKIETDVEGIYDYIFPIKNGIRLFKAESKFLYDGEEFTTNYEINDTDLLEIKQSTTLEENSETVEYYYSGIIAIDKTKNEYCHEYKVFQTKDLEYYIEYNSGVITRGSSGYTFSAETSIKRDNKATIFKIKIKLTYDYYNYIDENITVKAIDKDINILSSNNYSFDELPTNIKLTKDTEYIMIIQKRKDEEDNEIIDRNYYTKDNSAAQVVKFNEDGIGEYYYIDLDWEE